MRREEVRSYKENGCRKYRTDVTKNQRSTVIDKLLADKIVGE